MSEQVNAPLDSFPGGSPSPTTSDPSSESSGTPTEHPMEAIAASSDEKSPEEEIVASEADTEPDQLPEAMPTDSSEVPASTYSEDMAEAEQLEAAHSENGSAVPETAVAPVSAKHWYVVKVQSGREDTIKEAIERRMRKEGLEEYFGQIVIPVEKYTEIKQDKNGKRVTRTKERKLYPGYLMVEVEYNDRILYLFRETSGVGDFVGAHPGDLTRPPTPMSDNEVKRMIGPMGGKDDDKEPVSPKPKWLQEGDRVRVVDGTFNGMEGTVKHILESVSQVQVELTIFGRPVPVDLEYYQVEQL